jgi:hypothetical protein
MPRRSTESLVNELAGRIAAPGESAEAPFILQDRIPQTRTRHVVVIWDAWADRDRAERAGMIMDAYAASGRLGDDTIPVAMGLTEPEALDLGYLPYSIIALRKNTDPVSPADLKRALEQIGGVQVRKGSLLEVRFPTSALAQHAYRLLLQRVPGPYWQIQHEKVAADVR